MTVLLALIIIFFILALVNTDSNGEATIFGFTCGVIAVVCSISLLVITVYQLVS